jgi:hypothetical protein
MQRLLVGALALFLLGSCTADDKPPPPPGITEWNGPPFARALHALGTCGTQEPSSLGKLILKKVSASWTSSD